MREEERKEQLRKRIKYGICVAIGVIVGIIAGILIGRGISKTTSSEPALYTETEQSVELGESELSDLVYDNYWNFIRMSYIIVGNDPETAELYKISSNVARHNYDLERFLLSDTGYMTYSDDNITAAKLGIDVSSYQGSIDWEAVASTEVDFVMIRLGRRGYTEGGLMLDTSYEENITGALENGLSVGVYFFSQAVSYEEGVEEAEYVLANISGYDITYPIVIDTEQVETDDDARANNITNDERTDAIVGFCETIKAAGYTPMIYANRNWYAKSLDMDRLGDYKLWLAQYANVPGFPYLFTGWQYTSEGTVSGITGYVDLNVWME